MKKLLVVTGPSGVGKTYLAEQCLKQFPDQFTQVALHTTRQPRAGEKFVDRIFISNAQFMDKKNRGDFMIAQQFNGNWYGWDKDLFEPGSKHIIVNIWPSLVPQFSKPEVLFVGLSIDSAHIELLKERMLSRGDAPGHVEQRLKVVRQDLADLARIENQIAAQGKLFVITGDQTIPDVVLPWIEKKLL